MRLMVSAQKHGVGPGPEAGGAIALASQGHLSYGDLIIISQTIISDKPLLTIANYLARGMKFKFSV